MLRLDEIIACYRSRGHQQYGGEAVSQLEHACQCAQMAAAAGADESLIAAAFLHDVGHLLHDLGDDCANRGVDDAHEVRAVRALAAHFPEAVTAPIALHVDAKRYLLATESAYAQILSPASVTSLQLQGGVMSDAEVAAFSRHPHAAAAIALRRWDDAAKDPRVGAPDCDRRIALITRLASANR